jgi:hypothetical protein
VEAAHGWFFMRSMINASLVNATIILTWLERRAIRFFESRQEGSFMNQKMIRAMCFR